MDDRKPLDATDTRQILLALQEWLNALEDPDTGAAILPMPVGLEFTEGEVGLCIKAEGGAVLEEDITGDFSAELPFLLMYTAYAVPDGTGEVFKPLNDVAAWVKVNGATGLDLGERRTPDEIRCTRGATDASGKDEKGLTTFVSVFVLTYDEEARNG